MSVNNRFLLADYEKEIFNMGSQKSQDDHYTHQEKAWQDAGKFTGKFASKSDLSSAASSKSTLKTSTSERSSSSNSDNMATTAKESDTSIIWILKQWTDEK